MEIIQTKYDNSDTYLQQLCMKIVYNHTELHKLANELVHTVPTAIAALGCDYENWGPRHLSSLSPNYYVIPESA
jgi:hypothetical protein